MQLSWRWDKNDAPTSAWSGMDKKWRAPNGSILEFGYCKYESDVYHYQSAQYADIEFDELTHFSAFQYEYLKSRIRLVF